MFDKMTGMNFEEKLGVLNNFQIIEKLFYKQKKKVSMKYKNKYVPNRFSWDIEYAVCF